MTNVVISQPMYFPWPGFLAQLSLADVVVWLDDVQFSKGSFTNRVQVRMPTGISWLSIPLEGKGSSVPIAELAAAKPGWLDAHIATLKQSFKGAAHRDSALDAAQLDLENGLCRALIASSENLATACGISLQTTLISSDMNIPGGGSNRVLEIVKSVGGTRYITGHGARNYLDHAAFEGEGVTVDYMSYDVKPWWGDESSFSPYVTGLDLLAHVGGDNAASYLNPKTENWHAFLQA